MTEKNIRGNNCGTFIADLGLPVRQWLQQALDDSDDQKQEGLLKISLVCSVAELEQNRSELTCDAMHWQICAVSQKRARKWYKYVYY